MSQALVFPGQGAQYVGMGASLAAASPAAKAVLDEADEILGMSLSGMLADGPETELTRTDISQPAILVASWMAHQALCERQGAPECAAVAGLSLGEYTALVAAGALGFGDALRLVRIRGEAMQAAADARAGGMVALIGADEASAAALCDAVRGDGQVHPVANLNSPGQVVIAGDAAACQRAAAAVKDHGIRRGIALSVAGAFHSPHMAPAAERLGQAIAETRFADPTVPVYANVTAEPVRDADGIGELLIRQLTEPVRFADSCLAMAEAGVDRFLELGPGKTLSGMIARTVEGATCVNLDTADDLSALA